MNIIHVYKQFPTQKACMKHLEAIRWHNIPTCPYCKSTRSTAYPEENRYHCNVCNTSYSVTVGTIFHKTKVDLQKWFLVASLVLNGKKGFSARQIARDIEVNKNTGWFMLMRLRGAMRDQGELLKGIVEADEACVGGKKKNKRSSDKNGEALIYKLPSLGVSERGGKVKDAKGKTFKKAGRSI